MPLLLIPLLVLGVVALWAVLLPFALLQRYRFGKARRRAQPWIVRTNAWLLSLSALPFVLGAWVSGHWMPGALLHALAGLAAGIVLGVAGAWTTRYERTPEGLYYTPNPWLVLGITLLVAARIALGVWQLLRHLRTEAPVVGTTAAMLADHASLFALAGLLLGHYGAYAWCLRRRLSR